jgi:lipoprotein-anchoring transpeptidase ErfK/SrfK
VTITPAPLFTPETETSASPSPELSPLDVPTPSPAEPASPPPAPSASPSAPPSASAEQGLLRLQLLLDRAHFSPGEIDGKPGGNTSRALDGFRRERGLRTGGPAREDDWKALETDGAPTVVDYTLTEKDVNGPYEKSIPVDMMEKAKLGALSYTSALEALGERFHCSPKLLQSLNPGQGFGRAGEAIRVPNARRGPAGKTAKLIVADADQSVIALDNDGHVIARYPATMGSEHDPLPIGTWKVTGVSKNPPFFYNPDLFWDAKGDQSKTKIAPGPNNPVGVVWIDLSKPHYGIHGTPEPSKVGKTESHGCIRLTNWDAEELSLMVSPGILAILTR